MVERCFTRLSCGEWFDVDMEQPGSSLLEQDLAKLIVQTLKLKTDPAAIEPEAASAKNRRTVRGPS